MPHLEKECFEKKGSGLFLNEIASFSRLKIINYTKKEKFILDSIMIVP
jgi:hypothetical protein